MEFDEATTLIQRPTDDLETLRTAYLIVIAGSEIGKMYKVSESEMVIGRSVNAAIRIVDEGVSRHHAQLLSSADGNISLLDLESTNGTFCNGDKVARQTLNDGDKIQIGTTTILKFSMQDTLDEDFQRRQYESATRDALTGCYNRKYFVERMATELAFAQRHKKPLSLAIMDVDHFKKFNDTYGHQTGDFVLKSVAEVVQEAIRLDDILSRYGGEEFVVIMRATNADEAFIAAERWRRKIEAKVFESEGLELKVAVSIGVSTTSGEDDVTEEELIEKADNYLYRAKENGRNRTESEIVD